MRRSLVYLLPDGRVKVAYRDMQGRRYWRTLTKEEYITLYGDNQWMPKYEDLPQRRKRR